MANSTNPIESPAADSPYELLLRAALVTPITHYLLIFSLIFIVFIYNFLEIHFLRDLFSGFRGQPVTLTFNPSSQLYNDVVSKCRVLHGRYLSTPWLCSPHLQTSFLHYFGNSPVVNYRREVFMASDGGTIALDWVINAEVQCGDTSPIMIIIPGLASASDSAYVKHLAFKMAKGGYNVVVSNHRGLGGVPITSDRFYTADRTDDLRALVDHIHRQYPEAPIFAVGTSVGANILVKYLGEDGVDAPIIGAAAICSPWDSLIVDRFLRRRFVQRLYNKALTAGLKDYANWHKDVLSRLSNWEGVKQARSVRDFDDAATRFLANCETVDAYYRQCSSCKNVEGVRVPLLCISSLDDPICTSEAIPWDECRLNNNVVLATTQHGGHLPYFEGFTAKSVWWVRAVDEFFTTLSLQKKEIAVSFINPIQTSDCQSPLTNITENGIVPTQGQNGNIGIRHRPEREI
ncbi:hypothetical protein ACP275_02G074100 [Erythranthe tilingii]